MAPGDGGANALLVVCAVAGEGRHGSRDLVEQGADLGAVVHLLAGQRRRDDLPGVGVQADVRLAPGPACFRAVFLDQPLARAAELQAGAVHQRARGAGVTTRPPSPTSRRTASNYRRSRGSTSTPPTPTRITIAAPSSSWNWRPGSISTTSPGADRVLLPAAPRRLGAGPQDRHPGPCVRRRAGRQLPATQFALYPVRQRAEGVRRAKPHAGRNGLPTRLALFPGAPSGPLSPNHVSCFK